MVGSPEYFDKTTSIDVPSIVFNSITKYPDCLQLCVYGLSCLDYTYVYNVTSSIKMEEVLRLMNALFESHGSDMDYQEAFSRCLSKLLEINKGLHMFIGDISSDTHDSIRYELLSLCLLCFFSCYLPPSLPLPPSSPFPGLLCYSGYGLCYCPI